VVGALYHDVSPVDPLWDLDEGYLRPNALQAAGMAVFRPIEGATMALIRRARRAP